MSEQDYTILKMYFLFVKYEFPQGHIKKNRIPHATLPCFGISKLDRFNLKFRKAKQ